MKPGDRVGVILGSRGKKTVEVLGYGVYEGHFPVDEAAVGFMASARRLIDEATVAKGGKAFGNPRIKLDSGETVFGCECWWGSEEAVRKTIRAYKRRGLKIRTVTVAQFRERVRRGKP